MLPLLLALASPAHASVWSDFEGAITRVEQMVWDQNATSIAARHGLDVVNVTWEDTGRYKGSAVGPNISDMTIGVRDGRGLLHPMPVMRFDNFTDVTADIDMDDFWVRVGNERGRPVSPINLSTLLRNPRAFMHDPSEWAGSGTSLLSSRDQDVLVSAQACFLPIPQYGSATFTPVLYNYQSSPGNPAVLAIVATREGTSMQVIENDAGYLSQPLFFNDAGRRAPFVAERASDFRAHGGDATSPGYVGSADDGLNVVLLIQVPLVHQERRAMYDYDDWGPVGGAAESAAAPMAKSSDVENAVVSHGPVEGPFREFDHLPIQRDSRFPVRVTVQFYKATSNGVVTDADVAALRRQIDRVYRQADWVGSLVTEGMTGRTTEWYPQPYPTPVEPSQGQNGWADSFWTWMKP